MGKVLLLGQGSPRCYLPEPITPPELWEVAKSHVFVPTGCSCSAGDTAHGNAFPKLQVYLLISFFPAAAPAHGALFPSVPIPRCCTSCAAGVAPIPKAAGDLPSPQGPCAQLCPVPRAGRGLPGWVAHQNKVMKCDRGTGPPPTPFTAQPHGSSKVTMRMAALLLPGSLGGNLARAAAG